MTMRNISDYEVIGVLGCGSSGTCFKVRHRQSGEFFAWKAVDYDTWVGTLNEFEVLLKLRHPNIVEHLDYIVNKETNTVYIVMEYCEGGDLLQLIEQCKSRNVFLLEDFVWRSLYQICRALQMCHSQLSPGLVLHRDIKPANVFLDGCGNAKVGDFGLAKMLPHRRVFAESFVGTPFYMSPEVVKGQKYSRKSDVWSLGCLVYEMCALRPPFRGRRLEQLSQNISRGTFTRIPNCYSCDLQEIISFMLNVDNDSRPNIDTVLRHPILAKHIPRGEIVFPPFINISSEKPSPNAASHLSSTTVHEDLNSLSTPALRSRLFGSIHRRLFTASNPDLTCSTINTAYEDLPLRKIAIEPSVVTQNIFNEALAERLHGIRVRESLIKQKEAELDIREKQLNERSKRIAAKEKSLEALLKRKCSVRRSKKPSIKPKYDDIDSSLAPNETITPPTVAKLDLAQMKRPKAMQRVSFQSPKKFVQYNIENLPPGPSRVANLKSSTASDESEKNRRMKSVLSFFSSHKPAKVPEMKKTDHTETLSSHTIANKWTDENKKAAFKILAEMNGSGRSGVGRGPNRRSFIVPKSYTDGTHF